MRSRSLATAAAAALVLCAVAGPASARGTAAVIPQPAAGTATSALNLLSLALAGHAVQVGGLALTSDTVSGNPVAKVVVTPLKVDGVAYGEQSVTPASSPATVPVVDSASAVPAALAGLASVKSPAFDVSASNSDGASSRAGAASLGSVSVLGLPVKLDGSLSVASLVNGTNAVGEKTVTVKNLALPSVADLLAALGLDLPKLPVDVLRDLLTQLNLTSTAVTTAGQALDAAIAPLQAQVDALQAQIDAASAALAAKTAELAAENAKVAPAEAAVAAALAPMQPLKDAVTAAEADLAAKNVALASATTDLNAQIALLGATSPLLAPFQTAVTTAQAAVASSTTTLNAAKAALLAASGPYDLAVAALNALKSSVATLQGVVDGLQKTLDDMVALLKTLLAGVQPLIDTLLAAITGLLDATPLVSIDSITVQTKALVTSATEGGQTATIAGGEIVGLKVLGTDVLSNVLGNTKVDLLDLVGGTLSSVTSKINGLTGTLSSVLSTVPALPSLSIPAPQIGLLTKSTSTSIVGGFGLAENSIKALTITIPAITLPAAVALPNAASLPAISGLPLAGAVSANAVGDLVSKPITLGLVSLGEQSKFRPAVTAAPGANPGTNPGTTPGVAAPQLPTTGLPAGVALFSILLVGAGLVLRRRLADGTQL